MAYWNGHVFFACSDDFLRDYAVKNGQLLLNRYSNTRFENPRCYPIHFRKRKKRRYCVGHRNENMERRRKARVANGRVYFSARGEVEVYGLLKQR